MEKLQKCSLLLPQQFPDTLSHLPNANFKDVSNFIRISPSNMKKPYSKNTDKLLSTKSCNSISNF